MSPHSGSHCRSLLPHVRALVERDDLADVDAEELRRREDLALHLRYPHAVVSSSSFCRRLIKKLSGDGP